MPWVSFPPLPRLYNAFIQRVFRWFDCLKMSSITCIEIGSGLSIAILIVLGGGAMTHCFFPKKSCV